MKKAKKKLIKAYANFAFLFAIVAWAAVHIYLDTSPGLFPLDLTWSILIALPAGIAFCIFCYRSPANEELFRYMVAVALSVFLWEIFGGYVFYSIEAVAWVVLICSVIGDLWSTFGGKLTIVSLDCCCDTD